MWSAETFKNVMVGLSPIVIAVVGWQFTAETRRSEVSAKYVELAVEILNNKDLNEERGEGLRRWAVQVVNKHSVVEMDSTVQQFVINGGLVPIDIDFAVCLDLADRREVDCPEDWDPFPDLP